MICLGFHCPKLHPAPWNPRTIKDDRFKNLCRSLEADPEFMALRPVLATLDGTIYAGNMRFRAAQHLGWTDVEARLTDVPDQLAKERALRDNAGWGENVDESLGTLLAELKDAGSDIDLLGFESAELDRLLNSVTQLPEEDAADLEPPVDPITKPGDLWLLGDHRLLCGDSTSVTDVERLMDGEIAALCLTDPPYNVGIDYGEQVDDEQSRQRYLEWSQAWFAIAGNVAKCVVVTVGMVNLPMWYRDIAAPIWLCSWRKANQQSPSGLRGWNGWEPLLVYGKPVKAVGQDAWDIPVALDPMLEGKHAVPKTLKAWATFLEAFTERRDVVLDVFSGAGTTLIAAEQLGRHCRALEINPAYVDVGIERWERLTGKYAVLADHATARI